VSVVEEVKTLGGGVAELSEGGVKMGVGVWKVEVVVVVVRLIVLVIVKGGRRLVVQARIGGLA
jgi:hypothetical protein